MILPMDVRYKCTGCDKKIDATEHARNLTVEDVPMDDGFKHTMTVILCDTCKPKYDAIVRATSQEFAEVDTLAAIKQVRTLAPIGDDEGVIG